MNITFLIGNGFDLNLGLKTGYKDFYKYFLQNANENNIIRNWIDGKEDLWADLEEKLGESLVNLEDDQLEQFYASKEEMDYLLLDYIYSEQEKYNFENKDTINKEMIRSLSNFDIGLSRSDKELIEATLSRHSAENYAYRFISFNYTNCLDAIVEITSRSNPIVKRGAFQNSIGGVLHIHGTIEEEMILGVNDVSQIGNQKLKSNEEFLDTFIKNRMNRQIGQRKTEDANAIIDNSHIVCVFGMSIGNTDKMWWEKLMRWLMLNSDNMLIVFSLIHDEFYERKNPSRIIRTNNRIKKIIFDKGRGKLTDDDYKNIKNRIIISYNANIFNFPDIARC